MVYVVLGSSESISSTLMRLPEVLISGISTCGGEITTFSEAFSIFTASSKRMEILRERHAVAP